MVKQPWFLTLFHKRMDGKVTAEEFDEETSTKQLRLDYTEGKEEKNYVSTR